MLIDNPPVIVFSSVSENTLRFANKLNLPFLRLPLLPKDPIPVMKNEYVLLTPTYGGGRIKGSVPKQVVKFFNKAEENRQLCRGTIVGGNTTFGVGYATAGKIIEGKIDIPLLHVFEVLGMKEDVETVREILFTEFPDLEEHRNAPEASFAQATKFNV